MLPYSQAHIMATEFMLLGRLENLYYDTNCVFLPVRSERNCSQSSILTGRLMLMNGLKL